MQTKRPAADPGTQEPLFLYDATLRTAADLEASPGAGCPSKPRRRKKRGVPSQDYSPLPAELAPRRRLIEAGPRALSSTELVAAVLGDGAQALALAGEILSENGGIRGLSTASYHDLVSADGVDHPGASALVAAVELAVRLQEAKSPERPMISSPADVHALLGPRMRGLDRESFVVVLLDTKNRVISAPTVAVGTLSSCLVHPREVFKPAVRASAAFVVAAHNHPSGDTRPSTEDRTVTKKLAETGSVLGIELLDHIIVGDGYLSLKEQGTF